MTSAYGEIALRAADKICVSLFFAEPLPLPLGGAVDGPGASSTTALLATSLTFLFVLTTDGSELRSRGMFLRILSTEPPPPFISSSLSISGHNSPILALDDPSGVALVPSLR
jgi:hypothetical protein